MELLTHDLTSTLILASWLTICLIGLVARATHVERQTRSIANEYYSQYESK